MIDTHSHIDMLKNPEFSIVESINSGVEKIIVPSASPSGFSGVISLTERFDSVYGALGVHPEDVKSYDDEVEKQIYAKTLENKKLIAIGEIGLDYYWDKSNKEQQKDVFKRQLEIALSLDIPVLVHDREAHEDTFEILKSLGNKKVILHCFSGSVDFAKECIKQGWILGVGGVVTFKNSRKLKEVIKAIPLEKIVLETDAPYLTPHPFRGEENSPKYLHLTAKEIANLKDTSFENVDKTTTKTAKEFFNIKE